MPHRSRPSAGRFLSCGGGLESTPLRTALPCGCSLTSRCATAWDLRDVFQQARRGDDRAARHAILLRYTAHIAPLNPQWPPGTEAWPLWSDREEHDPRHHPTIGRS